MSTLAFLYLGLVWILHCVWMVCVGLWRLFKRTGAYWRVRSFLLKWWYRFLGYWGI